jgi:hypothetical protein
MRRAINAAHFTPHPQKRKTIRIGKDSDTAETVGIAIKSKSTRPPKRLRRILFHIAKAFGISTTSADRQLPFKVAALAHAAEPNDPLKWIGLGYKAYFDSVRKAGKNYPLTAKL